MTHPTAQDSYEQVLANPNSTRRGPLRTARLDLSLRRLVFLSLIVLASIQLAGPLSGVSEVFVTARASPEKRLWASSRGVISIGLICPVY